MQTIIRKIGNSRGVIIPASFLREAGLKDEVEITLKENALVITPKEENLRAGWYENFTAEGDVNAWEGYIAEENEEDDWEWYKVEKCIGLN